MDSQLKEFLEALDAKMQEYCDNSPKDIPTCDLSDVWGWIDEIKSEMGLNKDENNGET